MDHQPRTPYVSRFTLYALRPYFWPLGLLVAANSLIIFNTPTELGYLAALMLLAFLPGWVWLQVLLLPSPPPILEVELKTLPEQDKTSPASPLIASPLHHSSLLHFVERLTLAMGLSLALTIIGTMFAVYLPGTFNLSQLLSTIDVVILAGLAIIWQRHRSPAPPFPRSPISR